MNCSWSLFCGFWLGLICFTQAQSFNDYDQSPHDYWTGEMKDPMTLLMNKVMEREIEINEEPGLPLLHRLLEALQISKHSQVLVFSRTSLQRGVVSPVNPRAIYFNEDTYLGWMPGGRIEIASSDPEKGSVFFFQRKLKERNAPLFARDRVCIECHAGSATNFLPGPLGRSVFPDSKGRTLKSVDSFEQIGHDIPFHERWGGWYVTGVRSGLRHMGNAIATRENGVVKLNSSELRDGLDVFFNTKNYPVPTSDIEALLVFDHQVSMQFSLLEASYMVRQAIYDLSRSSAEQLPEQRDRLNKTLEEVTKQLVAELLFQDEALLGGEVVSPGRDSKFISDFLSKRRADSEGRSLRDFDLEKKIFKYRCSYMIESKSFSGLPKILKNSVYGRMKEILLEESPVAGFEYLPTEERSAIFDILTEILPGFTKPS